MQSLLKPYLVITLLLISGVLVKAQVKLKLPDVIQKIDKTSLEVVIDEINKTEILYRKANDPKGPLYAIPKKEVRRIIWNNGDVEDITLAPVVNPLSSKPADTKASPEIEKRLFWGQKGLFAGVRAGAGIGMVSIPHSITLASGSKLAYNIGGTLGYRLKSVSVQIEALYTGLSYIMNVPNGLQGIKNITGQQANLVVPLTATAYTKIGSTKVGFTLGAFGSIQVGSGSTKVTYSENRVANVKNCQDCSSQPVFGVVGGISATVFERPGHSIFIDARYYYNLGNNTDYKIAETGVKINSAIIGAGVLFNLSH